MNTTPLYDVVIASYYEPFWKLVPQILEHAPQSRVRIMDNGNRHYLWVKDKANTFLLEDNIGFVKATNAGIAMSTAPYVVLLNDDTMIYNNVFDRMRYYFEQDPKVGIVGAVQSPGFSWVCINNRREIYDEYAHITKESEISQEGHAKIAQDIAVKHNQQGLGASMVPFFCVMSKREVIEKVGYLSEEYGVGLGDDDDYCERVHRAGYKVLLALDCYVYHKQRTTFKELYTPEQIKDMTTKNIAFFKQKWGKEIV